MTHRLEGIPFQIAKYKTKIYVVLCSIFSCTLLRCVIKYSVIMFNTPVRYVVLLIWNLLSPKTRTEQSLCFWRPESQTLQVLWKKSQFITLKKEMC